MNTREELLKWAGMTRREALLDWARERNPIPKIDVPDTCQEIFDRILTELIETIDSGWGITVQKADQLWEMRARFLELKEGERE